MNKYNTGMIVAFAFATSFSMADAVQAGLQRGNPPPGSGSYRLAYGDLATCQSDQANQQFLCTWNANKACGINGVADGSLDFQACSFNGSSTDPQWLTECSWQCNSSPPLM